MPRTPQLVFTLTARSALMLWWQNIKQHWASLLSTDPLLDFFSSSYKTWQRDSLISNCLANLCSEQACYVFSVFLKASGITHGGERGESPPLSLYFGFGIILVFSRLFFPFFRVFSGLTSGFTIISQYFFWVLAPTITIGLVSSRFPPGSNLCLRHSSTISFTRISATKFRPENGIRTWDAKKALMLMPPVLMCSGDSRA